MNDFTNTDKSFEKDWTKVVDIDFPKVNEVTKKMTVGASSQSLQMSSCVRLMVGKLSTTKNLEERRQRALKPI